MEHRTILLVEDDLTYAEFISAAIAKAKLPFTVAHVTSVTQAFAYLKGEQPYSDRHKYPVPACVLLDLKLAAENSFPVLAWLQANAMLPRIRVIILTASDHTQDVQQALRLGAASYLLKSNSPSNVTDLLGRFALE
jgi:CheY-like chemotaxis protein